MELKQYWQILWKRRGWAILAFLAIVVSTGIVTFTMPPVYQATTKLLIEQNDGSFSAVGQEMAEFAQLSSLSRTGSPLDTQSELLKSVPVVVDVIKRVDLRNPVTGELMTSEEFLQNAKVTNIKGTDILQIAFQYNDPMMATQVADTWAQSFVETNRTANRMEASSAAKFINEQLEKTKRELAEAESALRDYKMANGAVDLSEEARTSVQSLANLEAEYRQASAASQEAVTRAAALRRQMGVSANEAMASTAISQNPTIVKLRQQLLELETNPLLSNASLTPNHPEVKQIQAQIATVRRTLAQEAAKVIDERYQQSAGMKDLDPVRQGLTKDLVQAEINSLGYNTRVDALKTLVGNFNGRLTNLPNKELQLTRLMRNASVTAELYKMLLQKQQEARISENMNLGNVRIVEEAVMPQKPIKPKKLQNMLVALMVGLMFGVGVAMFLEYLDDTIQTADDAETISQIPTLGIIPWLRSTSDAQLITLSDPRSPAAESYRTLRTNIKFLSTDSPLHTMTITSAGPEEGKSTTIANLGVSFAQTGKKVLIVDTDMRKPTIHAIFGLRSDMGVTSVLAGDMPLEQAIQGTEAENLHVLTCGPIPPNPAELLESQRFATLLEEVKSRYDVVLFDAPPIIAVTDASILAAKLDGLILLMGVNKVTRKAAKHALQLLASARVKVWGMVVRGVRPDNDGYYYAYYHRYYGTMERDRKKADKKSRARRTDNAKTAVVPQARPAAGDEATGDVLIDINKLKKG